MLTLTLMYREYCGLCRDMKAQLLPYQAEFGVAVEIVEIDDFPDLEAKYNEWVPVLLHGEQEICHWHLDETALRTYLQNIQAA